LIYPLIEAVIPIISYAPLWKTMKERSISQYQLLKAGIDNKTLDSLKKNKNITLLTLEKLCTIIGCTPNDVVEFTE
jgi:putative transcriptional regulator